MNSGDIIFGLGIEQLATLALIFFARIADVSLGTLRIVAVSRGNRMVASLLGFLEVLIWLITIGQVLHTLQGWVSYITYAAGFAVGTFIGMTIQRGFTADKYLIRIIIPELDPEFYAQLNRLKTRITYIPGHGPDGPVQILFTVVDRDKLKQILAVVKTNQPDAYYSIEDVRYVHDYTPGDDIRLHRRPVLQPFYWFRKSK